MPAVVDTFAGSRRNRVVTETDVPTVPENGPKTRDVAPESTNANRDAVPADRLAETPYADAGDRIARQRSKWLTCPVCYCLYANDKPELALCFQCADKLTTEQ